MKVICSNDESLYRPEAVRWRERMNLMNPIGDTVVLLPCSMKKPYSNSKSHMIFRKVTRSFQELIITSPFGICPRELENTFPIQSYDVAVTGNWSQNEIDESGKLLERYIGDKKVVANVSGGYKEVCEQYLDDCTYTCLDGRPTSHDSIYNLRMELKNHKKVSRRERVLHELRSIAIYQWGEKAIDFIPDNVKTRGMFHRKILVDNKPIAMLNGNHGLYTLNLKGGEILNKLGLNIVEIDFNLETNTVFAPGIINASSNIIPQDEVVVVRNNEVVGVGKAVMTSREMLECGNGVGVKIKYRVK